jgi:MraZ protein
MVVMRGNSPAKVDAQGRLKVPTAHRKVLEDCGPEVYVTSLVGDNVLIYPMTEWEKIERKMLEAPKKPPEIRRFIRNSSYFGQVTTLDKQGRILIHPLLREAASINGDVDVIGQLNCLVVWNHEKILRDMDADPYTERDEAALAELGIF